MDDNKKLENIMEALSRHEDNSAVAVLEEVGTNSQDDEVRTLAAKALVNRNTKESLDIVISKSGKGINDLSTSVAMSTINELLAIEDRENLLNVLEEAIKSEDEAISENANSVKTLLEFA